MDLFLPIKISKIIKVSISSKANIANIINAKNMLYIAIIAILLFSSCQSNKVVIPDDANAMQLIQMGQDALNLGNYDKAAKFYNATIQRYGTDTAIYVEACYELGHLFARQKHYSKAVGNFEEVLAIFENAEFGSLPAAYRKLSQMGLDSIPKRYKSK